MHLLIQNTLKYRKTAKKKQITSTHNKNIPTLLVWGIPLEKWAVPPCSRNINVCIDPQSGVRFGHNCSKNWWFLFSSVDSCSSQRAVSRGFKIPQKLPIFVELWLIWNSEMEAKKFDKGQHITAVRPTFPKGCPTPKKLVCSCSKRMHQVHSWCFYIKIMCFGCIHSYMQTRNCDSWWKGPAPSTVLEKGIITHPPRAQNM